ncbi:putative outer membrane starch-binding protein [Mucilaginibacter gracilis]|uniref:Putative outer membrane starch-binding protein n=1 Tax=Mucilaginibacter gracilis TaxID=423350 RepID=A0A495J5J5_9SPHI|nr:RagB/SusD family nutrient uptake outer membrane protein [Mucilaginibacter gracilis]RKR84023.1 putative outer membrane starch-binding protein [Mucilaginibacter gracilis]
MKKYLIIIILLGSLTSCKKFLDLAPEAAVTTNSFYVTASDFNAAVVSCYSALRSYPTTEIFPLVEYRSDNMYVKAFTAGSQDQYMINKFNDVSANSLTTAAWSDMYNGVLKCNEVTSRIENATFSANLKAQYDGEARFIRALYYFTLVRMYGGVPLVQTPISVNEALSTPRSSVADVYASIESDLNTAITELPETYASTDLGRVRASAAKTLLSKVYITEGNFSAAQPVLLDVIKHAGYSLQTNIANVFSVSTEMNSEVIFAIRFAKSLTGGGHGAWFSPGADSTTSEVNASLIAAYKADARRKLLSFTKSGSIYYINKYADVPDATTKNFDNDFIVLRYADVLLMYAECLNEISALNSDVTSESSPLFWLNQVRKRSSPTVPFTAAQYTSQSVLRDIIIQERWLEFPLEGQRWFDLIRTKSAKTQLLKNSGTGAAPITDVPDFRLIYPIPNAEIQKVNNPQILSQNPGYN